MSWEYRMVIYSLGQCVMGMALSDTQEELYRWW